MSKTIQKITPFLWFESHAEEAVNFYLSIFKNSRIVNTTQYGDGAPQPKGSVMTISMIEANVDMNKVLVLPKGIDLAKFEDKNMSLNLK